MIFSCFVVDKMCIHSFNHTSCTRVYIFKQSDHQICVNNVFGWKYIHYSWYLRLDVSKPLTLLSSHDALKHHSTSLRTDLIFQQPGVLE